MGKEKGAKMDKYDALKYLKDTVLPTTVNTKWHEPISIAVMALEHEIWAEEDVCESCKINPVRDAIQEMFGGGMNK